MKNTYNSLKRNEQDDGQWFLVHFRGEYPVGYPRAIQMQLIMQL